MIRSRPLDPKSLSLTLFVLISTYTSYLSGVPPNPTPYDSTEPDSLRRIVSPRALIFRRSFVVGFGLFHAYLTLTYPTPSSTICPRRSNLNPSLFTWTPYSIFYLTLILLGSYIRLSAFSALGKDFTFRLARPRKLVTTGLYSYVQHPSYTGKILIVIGNLLLIQNQGGSVGCWLPRGLANATWVWMGLGALMANAVRRRAAKRMEEEEKMLKETFGEEWERWHEKTARLIPGIY